ncbi:hypothetical protein C8R47DRAFT_816421 [Mycena vitilis]|nr:hypothetical protein C8R47DRAFT_816421 [Mycena vitilis]
MPKGSSPLPSNSRFTHQDAQAFERALPGGGTICSTHHPKEALSWVEAHHSDRLLALVRSHGLGGPMATMLFPEMQALAIFGPIEKTWVLRAAKVLADASGFPVIIQPRSNDPLLAWNMPADIPAGCSNGNSHNGYAAGGMAPPTADGEVEEAPWMSPIHTSNIRLQLCPAPGVAHDVVIFSETQFKVQSSYEKKDRHGFHGYRPQVVSRTSLKVTSIDGLVLPDRSYSSVGFLVRDQFICDDQWIDCGSDRRTRESNRQNLRSRLPDFSLNPLRLSLRSTSNKCVSRKTEDYNDWNAPKWTVSHEQGPILTNSDGAQYVSWDITYDADLEKNSRHPLEITVSTGINVPNESDPQRTAHPQVAFICRTQTMLWVPNDALKSKGFGITIVTSSYIADCRSHSAVVSMQEAVRHMFPADGALHQSSDRNSTRRLTKANFLSSLILTVPSLASFIDRWHSNFELAFFNGNTDTVDSRGWAAQQNRWTSPIYPALDGNSTE